jgi:hypothetical protein
MAVPMNIPEPLFALLIVLAIVLVLAAPFAAWLMWNDRARKPFIHQVESLGEPDPGPAEITDIPQGINRILAAGGHEIRLHYYTGQEKAAGDLSLAVAVNAQESFRVGKHHLADAMFEGLGLEGRIATPDPRFDARWHVVSDEPAFAAACFASSAARQAVETLLREGCHHVLLEAGELKAVWEPFQPRAGMGVDFIRRSLSSMAALAEAIPAAEPSAVPFQTGGLEKRTFDITLGVSGIAGLILMYALMLISQAYNPLDRTGMFLLSLRASLPLSILGLLSLVVLLRGRTWFALGLLEGAATFPFLVITCWFATTVLDIQLDAGTPSVHRAAVVRKFEDGYRGTTWKVEVDSWRPGHVVEELRVTEDQYAGVRPGCTWAMVTTQPGFLGQAWVTALQFETRANVAR